MIDSGSLVNLNDTKSYEQFKFKPSLTIMNEKIYTHKSKGPLLVKEFFKANVAPNQNTFTAKLYISQGSFDSILNKTTVEELNLLKLIYWSTNSQPTRCNSCTNKWNSKSSSSINTANCRQTSQCFPKKWAT